MNFGFLEFAFAFVLFCSNVESTNSYTCYNDTITLNEIIVQPFSGGTYHICAGTTINVGVADGRLGYKGGAFPIVLAHGGIKILCGENGSVENNCVFRGGDAAFEIINPGFYTRPTYKPTGVALLPGLHIEGFTFTGLKFPVFSYRDALAQVSLKVKNCKFVDNTDAMGMILIQTSNPHLQSIYVEDTHFIGNSLVMEPPKAIGQVGENPVGVIKGSYSATITVTNSTFYGNTFKTPIGANIVTDPQIQGEGTGWVTVTDSCFVSNNNLTGGLIRISHLNQGGLIARNHKHSNDFFNKGQCDGILMTGTGTNCTSEGFDLTECSILPATNAPTPAPQEESSSTYLPMPIIITETWMILAFGLSMYLF